MFDSLARIVGLDNDSNDEAAPTAAVEGQVFARTNYPLYNPIHISELDSEMGFDADDDKSKNPSKSKESRSGKRKNTVVFELDHTKLGLLAIITFLALVFSIASITKELGSTSKMEFGLAKQNEFLRILTKNHTKVLSEHIRIVIYKPFYKNCLDLYKQGHKHTGSYKVIINGQIKNVYCDMTTDGGGWLVIQRRFDGSVDFYKRYSDYIDGFGDHLGEFWFGLRNIHDMTSSENHELRVDLVDFYGNKGYAEYSKFLVGPQSTSYQLTVDGYAGTINDGMTANDGSKFSTFDNDHATKSGVACATTNHGGWWYNRDLTRCSSANLNGEYSRTNSPEDSAIYWDVWIPKEVTSERSYRPMKQTIMQIRPST